MTQCEHSSVDSSTCKMGNNGNLEIPLVTDTHIPITKSFTSKIPSQGSVSEACNKEAEPKQQQITA